jgi:chromosome segregation ATPase
VREEIDFVRLLTREQDGYGGVVSEQFSRLTSIHAFSDGDHVCPVCEQELQQSTPTVGALNDLLQATSRKLEAHQRDLPRMQETLEQLEQRELVLRTQLEDSQRALQALIAQRNEIERFRGLVNAQSYVRGRIAQYLEAVEEADDAAIAAAELLVADLEKRVTAAEERLGPDAVRDRLNSILGVIGQDMQRWAVELQLEHADSPLRIHPSELTVVADTRRAHLSSGDGQRRELGWLSPRSAHGSS